MSKKILILGASIQQMDAIRRAKELGYCVITVDNIPSNPGHALADRCYNVSTVDPEAVLSVAQSEQVDGVLSPATDVGVSTAAYVADKMGLSGPPLTASQCLTDKSKFRGFLKQKGFPVADFILENEFHNLIENWPSHHQWILKPTQSSGSKGIFIIRNPDDLEQRIPESKAYSLSGEVLLERFIEGFQGTCEGWIADGSIKVMVVTERLTAAPPYVATLGHRIPSGLDPKALDLLSSTLANLFSKVGVGEGPFDCDFVWDGETVYILEVTPRSGGNNLSHLLEISASFSLLEYSIQLACGDLQNHPSQPEFRPAAVELIGVRKQGRFLYDRSALAHLREMEWVRRLDIHADINSMVPAFTNGRCQLGVYSVVASSKTELLDRISYVNRQLNVRVDE